MLTFYHISDLHLGLRLKNKNMPSKIREERRASLWETFNKVILSAKQNNIDYIFITGDLFEDEYFTIGDIERVKNSFLQVSDIRIIISAGNHDYIHENSLYNRITWPKNVYIFGNEKIERLDFKDHNLSIYGYSWPSKEIKEDKIINENFIDYGLDRKILLLHGDLYDKQSRYLPLNKEKLLSLDLDYIGLGHIHKPYIYKNIAYPGCLEPTNFNEIGERGFIYGCLDERLYLDFISYSKRKFIDRDLRIKSTDSYLDIINHIDRMDNKNLNFYRINLNGYINSNINLDDLIYDIKDMFFYVEIKNNLILDFDIDFLKEKYSDEIIGLYISEVENLDLDDITKNKLLFEGLDSLLKEYR